MFYELVHEMALEMAFVLFAIWLAMTALGQGQTLFRRAVIGGVLLFGIASYFRMREIAIVFQLASLCLLLSGWICKLYWQVKIKRNRRGTDN